MNKDFLRALFYSVAIYLSKEAGEYGNVNFTEKEVGFLGAFLSKIQKIIRNFVQGEISLNTAKKELVKAINKVVILSIKELIAKGEKIGSNFLKNHFPKYKNIIKLALRNILEFIIPLTIQIVKDKIGEKTKKQTVKKHA